MAAAFRQRCVEGLCDVQYIIGFLPIIDILGVCA